MFPFSSPLKKNKKKNKNKNSEARDNVGMGVVTKEGSKTDYADSIKDVRVRGMSGVGRGGGGRGRGWRGVCVEGDGRLMEVGMRKRWWGVGG